MELQQAYYDLIVNYRRKRMYVLYIYLPRILYVLLNYATELEYQTMHSVLFTICRCSADGKFNDVYMYSIAPSRVKFIINPILPQVMGGCCHISEFFFLAQFSISPPPSLNKMTAITRPNLHLGDDVMTVIHTSAPTLFWRKKLAWYHAFTLQFDHDIVFLLTC